MKSYQVGGSVRDKLLGLPVNDRDFVVVGETSASMVAAGFKPVGTDFPVFLHPTTHEEYALARTERKSGKGYKGFVVHAAPDVTLEDDLGRRDLTINAMAEDDDGTIIDPHGGQRDIAQKVLRHVGPAFVEDPVRILRVARFAARFASMGFTVAAETLELMRAMVTAGEADHLVPERVWQELSTGLMEHNPSCMFDLLRKTGALERIAPEWAAAFAPGSTTQRTIDLAAQPAVPVALRYAIATAALSLDDATRLADRLKVPVECRELSLLTLRAMPIATHIETADAANWALLYETADALRRPERFNQFVIAFGYLRCGAGAALPSLAQPTQRMAVGLAVLQQLDYATLARDAQTRRAAIPETIRAAKVAALQLLIDKGNQS
jgi:tRNA nucleotidyltransferase (CCA-adding enzyme)